MKIYFTYEYLFFVVFIILVVFLYFLFTMHIKFFSFHSEQKPVLPLGRDELKVFLWLLRHTELN